MNFKSSVPYREFMVFDAYEIESDGSVDAHSVDTNGDCGMFYNPYQRKICAMFVRESHQYDKLPG